LTAKLVVKLAPVPEAGEPPVVVQEIVTGDEPPVVLAVHITGLPAVPVEGQLAVSISGWDETVTVVEPVADAWFMSLTVKLTVYVPLAGSVTVCEPVPL